MKIAVANRAEETQTCFTSSQLLSLQTRFLGPPQPETAWKKRTPHLTWSENVLGNWVVTLGWNLVSTCQRHQWAQCMGPNHLRRVTHRGPLVQTIRSTQEQAGWRTGHQELTAHITTTRTGPCFLDGAEGKVCSLVRVKDFKNCCFSDLLHVAQGRTSFLTLNLNLPENLTGKNENGTVIVCLLTEY